MNQVYPKTNFPEASNFTNGTVNKENYKNQIGIQLQEDGLLRCHGKWFMLNYLVMQYIQYFFPKGATSLH